MARAIAWERIGIKTSGVLSEKYETGLVPALKSRIVALMLISQRVGVFHIVEDKHTLVAGFKARFRIYIRRVFLE